MTRQRNVLFLQSSSDLYGSGKIIWQVLRLYKREGFNPIVLLTGPGPMESILKSEGFTVYIQNLGILRRKYVNPLGLINRIDKNLKAYQFLNQLHKKYHFELVYSNTLAVIIGAFWAKRKQIPHIWHIHEILAGPKPLVKLLSTVLDSSTVLPIAVSQAVADNWQPHLKKARIQVIHNGIPYEDFLAKHPLAKKELGLPEDQLIIGMIGRINPWKGQLFFLEIAEQLCKKYPNIHFALVGDPFNGYESILEDILDKIKTSGLEQRVSYLGFRSDVPKVLQAYDIFVLPSILPDPLPTVILEAMASGKPVVATKPGGSEEMLIDSKTGFLIPMANVSLGVEAIEKLISNPDLLKSFGDSGRARVLAEFSLEAFEEKIKTHLWQHLKRN